MRKITTFFLLFGFFALVGCSEQPEQFTMPEVNDENCRLNNLNKLEPEELRRKFAALCLNRDALPPGDKPKSWGPKDL
jgi:entry exclusion lipoprotein TrbK